MERAGLRGDRWLRWMLLPVLFLACPAEAYDPLQIPSSEVKALRIEGNEFLSDGDVRDRMENAKGGWFRSGRYRQNWLEKDLEAVLAYYRSLGFLDASISSRDVEWDRSERSVEITIVIDEGVRTFVDTVLFEGLPELPKGAEEKLFADLSLRKGNPFNPELLSRDQVRIYSRLADHGYPGAEVRHEESRESGRGTITFLIDPGPRVRFGSVRVEGTEGTRARFVERELTFREGEWYSRREVLKSRERVFQTGLYYNVAMIRDPVTPDGNIPIRVSVKEKKVRWFGFGGGFGTQDLVRLSVDWTNLNWLRTGRRIDMEAVFSDLLADRPFEHRYEVSLLEPWMFGTRTRGTIRVTHERQNVENFTVDTDGGEKVIERYRLIQTVASFSLSRELDEFTQWWVSLSNEWAKAEEPTEPVDAELLRPDVTRSLALTFERDTRDHLLDPSRGERLHHSLEFAGTFLGGDNEFVKATSAAAVYHKLTDRILLAGRVQVGGIRSLAPDMALPDYKRFRLGGANSVRGYREETIGPGNYSLLTNVELRIHLIWRIGGVFFLDGGNAWTTIRDVSAGDFRLVTDEERRDKNDYRYGWGGGIRVYTPVGPLRVDYASKTKRMIEGTGRLEAAGVLHFSIGQAF